LVLKEHLKIGEGVPSFSPQDEKVLVSVGSGWKLNALIAYCLDKGLVGLEWFAGIPGSLGGAVYMNIHGGNYFFSDLVYKVIAWNQLSQKQVELTAKELKFDYDYSVFQEKEMVILLAQLILYRGNIEIAKKIQQYWLRQKLMVQPQRSCGSVWQNLSREEQIKHHLPTPSIGYLIDHKLRLKGRKVGQAQISLKHAGFIENLGGAKGADVLELMRLVEAEAKQKLRINLKREVMVVGEE